MPVHITPLEAASDGWLSFTRSSGREAHARRPIVGGEEQKQHAAELGRGRRGEHGGRWRRRWCAGGADAATSNWAAHHR